MQFYNFDAQSKRPRMECAFLKTPSKKAARKRRVKTSDLPPVPVDLSCDTSSNPYRETPIALPDGARGHGKVLFVPETHQYCIVDDKGAYPSDYIASVSKLLDIYIQFQALEDLDEGEERLVRAIKMTKNSQKLGDGSRFQGSVEILSGLFLDYLNMVSLDHALIIPGNQTCFTFKQRREFWNAMQLMKPKDFSQFVPSFVFQEIEMWYSNNKPAFSPFSDLTDHQAVKDLVWMLGDLSKLVDEQLQAALYPFLDPERPPMTGKDIVSRYSIAATAGTALHAYLEHLFNVETGGSDLRARFPCREDMDYELCDRFVRYCRENGIEFKSFEARYASYRHKICGSIDGVRIRDDGCYEVWDWKRTPKFCDFDWWKTPGRVKHATLHDAPLSGDLVRYAIQIAGYRKLLILNGATHVSDIGRLVVMHPIMEDWAIIEFDMNERTQGGKEGALGGLAGYSPIEMIEKVFHLFENELERIFSKL